MLACSDGLGVLDEGGVAITAGKSGKTGAFGSFLFHLLQLPVQGAWGLPHQLLWE